MKKQRKLDADLEERALAAQAYLGLIGEGDWTPQDLASARVAEDMLTLLPEMKGLRDNEAKVQRKLEHLRRHTIGLIEKNETLRYELHRMEGKLAWIYRTKASMEEIREVIEKTISQRLKRDRLRTDDSIPRRTDDAAADIAREREDEARKAGE